MEAPMIPPPTMTTSALRPIVAMVRRSSAPRLGGPHRPIICPRADVSELVQEHASGACVVRHEGSTPSVGTEVPGHEVIPNLPFPQQPGSGPIWIERGQKGNRCGLPVFELVEVVPPLAFQHFDVAVCSGHRTKPAAEPLDVGLAS